VFLKRSLVLPLLAAACGSSSAHDAGAPDAAWNDVLDTDAGPIVRVSDIGNACTQNGDCSVQTTNAACETQPIAASAVTISFPDGYCILACDSVDGCPADSACVLVPGGVGICLEKCLSTSECRVDAGYCCIGDPFAANVSVCGAVDPDHQSACAP
jgi:hypothetical protein